MILFHGSNMVVQTPKVLINGFYKDFGYGFYCTSLEKQARRWALTKRKQHIVNRYIYNNNAKELVILRFEDIIEDFVNGKISRAAFWELVKFKYPTHQIVFCTEKALEALQFEGSYRL